MTGQGKLLAAAEDHNAEFDLLSSLPEHLIHHLLSPLTLKEIVKASAVCKSWRRIFSSFPRLDFQCKDFAGKGSIGDTRMGAERMARFVDATMTRFQDQHLKIDKFGIDYSWVEYDPSRVDRWIGMALDLNAHEITVAHPHYSRDTPKSLNLVALSGSTTNLKSVTLEGEFLPSWGRWLTSACGSLESLSLTRCRLEEVRISGFPYLKTVSITTGCTSTRLVEIEAPSLESFSLYNDFSGKRTHPCVVNVKHSPNLKSLTLDSVAENDDWFRDLLSRFQRLQCLTIRFCSSLRRIRVSNPLIEDIKIIGCERLRDISIAAPELRRFYVLTWFLPFIRMKIPPRRNPVATVTVNFHEQLEWPCKIREFLVGFCKSFSSLDFRASTRDFFLQLQNDIKYGWLGVVACNFEQLSLALRRATQETMPRAVDGTNVNGLIWTPHPATITTVAGLSDDGFLQLFFDKVAEGHSCSREACIDTNNSDIKIVSGSNN